MRYFGAILLFSVLSVVAPRATGQEPEKALPNVIEHAEPVYPALGRQARIMGEVRVRFTTDGHSVISADAETGHELLRSAAEQNVRTWKFAPHEPGTFHVTFRYKIGENDVVFLPPPALVEITEPVPIVQIDWAYLDRGRWKAHLRRAQGLSQRVVVELRNSGPEGHWLDGDVTDARGQKVEIDDGHFDELRNMFWFNVMLSRPKGEPLSTFFVGKISGGKITGTFVDDSGATGVWTATLEK